MYTLNLLFFLSDYCSFSTDGQTARQILAHMDALRNCSLQEFVEVSHISKAGLHRFYSKAGFSSFREFAKNLTKEFDTMCSKPVHIEPVSEFPSFKTLTDWMKEACQIVIYGDMSQIADLSQTIHVLHRLRKNVMILSQWSKDEKMRILQNLQKEDVFLFVDMKIPLFHHQEYFHNHPASLPMDEISRLNCHKAFLGGDTQTFDSAFLILSINSESKDPAAALNLADKNLAYLLAKGEIV